MLGLFKKPLPPLPDFYSLPTGDLADFMLLGEPLQIIASGGATWRLIPVEITKAEGEPCYPLVALLPTSDEREFVGYLFEVPVTRRWLRAIEHKLSTMKYLNSEHTDIPKLVQVQVLVARGLAERALDEILSAKFGPAV